MNSETQIGPKPESIASEGETKLAELRPRSKVVGHIKSYKGSGVYRHFKGNLYWVLGLSKHTETRERCVVYRPLGVANDGWQHLFHRPMSSFQELVQDGVTTVARFERLRREE